MSETTTDFAPRPEERAAAPSLLDRLLGAIPITSIVVWLALVYMVESTGRTSPTLFTDEMKWTQLSRAIEATGHAAQRGVPATFSSLYAYLIAPAWAIQDTAKAYDVAKYVTVAAMCLAAVPAYLFARRLVSKPAALFVAAATIAIPSMAYGLYLIPEGIAYPWSTLCAYLIAGALATRGRRWIAAAVVASLVAPALRSQLVVVPAAFALAAAGLWWTSARGRRWRAGWTLGDYVGFALLVAGVFFVLNRWLLHGDPAWAITTEFYRGWIWKHFHWALGALAIGIGVLPVVATIAWLPPARDERRSPWERSLAAVLLAYVLTFGLYTSVKAAYLEATFATRVTERNLFYVAPLLFLATAVALERRRVRLVPLAVGVGVAAALLATTPLQLDDSYFEAMGFSILTMANRSFYWTTTDLHNALWTTLAISTVALLAVWRLRDRPPTGRLRSAAGAGLALVGVALLAWNLTGQIKAARGTAHDSSHLLGGFPLKPPNWVDLQTGGAGVTYLGQTIANDIQGIDLLEFWNRSLVHLWSLDGTTPGPGPTLSPDLGNGDGRLVQEPGTPYLLADSGVDPAGTPVARVPGSALRLYRLHGPIRLRDWLSGISDDGWLVSPSPEQPYAYSSYSRFVTPRRRAGYAVVQVGRRTFCPDPARHAPTGVATITVGRLAINDNHQPSMGKVEAVRHVRVRNCASATARIPVGPPPWRVEVRVDGIFRPVDWTPDSTDARWLAATIGYDWAPR